MNDMRAVIIPRSDQLNSDSLIAGPVTITVSIVTIRPGTEQPVSISYEGDDGRPYKPCKSMARVMVHCWGADANAYIGRRMTLYCDPTVKWGGMAVGGIRISHMSDIKGVQTLALTETKGKKTIFTVKPLAEAAPPPPPVQSVRDWIIGLRAEFEAAPDIDAVNAICNRAPVAAGLADDERPNVKAALVTMRAAAIARTTPPSDDDFPDDAGRDGGA